MGKYLSNNSGIVGVKTRAKARSAAAALSSSSSMVVKKMKKVSNKVCDLRNRRRIGVVSEENLRPETVINSSNCSSDIVVVVETTVDCNGGDDVSADFPASCCSSNDNASICNNILADPDVESIETTSSRHSNLEERIGNKVETIELGNNLDCPVMRSRGRKLSVQIKMPLDSEIDAFFAAAEKDVQKRFADRYNFDVVKDEPLEGRYEWVPSNQALNLYK